MFGRNSCHYYGPRILAQSTYRMPQIDFKMMFVISPAPMITGRELPVELQGKCNLSSGSTFCMYTIVQPNAVPYSGPLKHERVVKSLHEAIY